MTEKQSLITLNRQRGAIKGQLTRIETFLQNPNKKPLECQAKLKIIDKAIDKLDNLKNFYFQVIEDDNDLQAHLEVFQELEEQAEEIEVRIQEFLLSSSNNDYSTSQMNSNVSRIGDSATNVKLPEIPLPKFSGNYQDWYVFKDQFITLIDSNDTLSETQKLYYLKSTLSGVALDMVSADDSYSSLFKALENRFQNKRAIVNSHINEILCMEMLSQDPAKSLRAIVDKSQRHNRTLKTIGLELNEVSEVMLINVILKKLDKEIFQSIF